MIQIKTVTSIFIIEEQYEKGLSKCRATVFLEVNYVSKTFTIKPTGQSQFVFSSGNKDSYGMWEAVGKCIVEAAQLAERELFNPPPICS